MTLSDDELVRELVTGGLDERAAKALVARTVPIVPPSRLRAAVTLNTTPSGGAYGAIDLVPGADSLHNSVGGATIPYGFSASSSVANLQVKAPVFSHGTLSVDYAVIEVSNAAGTQRLSFGGSGMSLASASNGVLALDDDASTFAKVGTDLTHDGSTVSTTAGGVYFVAWNVSFAVSGDFAT